jgi:hypothetical protein
MEHLSALWASSVAAAGLHLPRLVAAAAILAVAWIAARVAQAVTRRLATRFEVDRRASSPGLGQTLATLAHGLVWLLALPALLGTLGLDGLLAPISAMLERLLGFLPDLLGAVALLVIGVLVARLVARVVAGLLTAAGSERLAARLGLATALGDRTLAGIAGSLVFALILVPAALAALQALHLDMVAMPLARLLEDVLAFVPRLVAAAIVIGLGIVVGRAVADLATATLAAARFDRLPAVLGAGENWRGSGGRTASELAGVGVLVAVVLVAAMQASELLGLPLLSTLVAQAGTWLLRAVVALAILAAGLWVANESARRVRGSATIGRPVLVAQLVRGAVLFFALCLALVQAGLPATIVTILFAAVVGAVALGGALAAGLALGVGGQSVAARWLDDTARQAAGEGSANDRAPPAVVREP